MYTNKPAYHLIVEHCAEEGLTAAKHNQMSAQRRAPAKVIHKFW